MRIISYLVILFFLLVGSSGYSHDYSKKEKQSSQFFSKNKQIKYANADHSITLIDESEVDIEEEYSSDNHNNDFKFVFLKATSAIAKYSCDSLKLVYKKNFNNFNYFPSSFGNSTSIYLLNRVLRI